MQYIFITKLVAIQKASTCPLLLRSKFLKEVENFLEGCCLRDAKPVFSRCLDPALVASVPECAFKAFYDVGIGILTHTVIIEDIVM